MHDDREQFLHENMLGKHVVVKKLGPKPENCPENVLYVPFPEYGVALWFYPDYVDLKFADTDELINELCRRFPAFVFAGRREEEDETIQSLYRWKGQSEDCLGFVRLLQLRIERNELRENYEEADD